MTIRELFVYLGFDVDTSGAKKMDDSIDNVKKHQESMFSSFLKSQIIYDAGKNIISGAFNFVKDSVIGATAEVERYRVTLGTMIGDQDKANKIIHDLDYSPVSDFYGTANAIGGLQSLVTYGIGAEEASDALSRLGDIAQGDSEAFNSMAQNLGQIFATGKASSMDLKQFANRGFDVVGELSKLEGKSREEIEKMGVGYNEVKKALDSLTSAGGKYEGMLSKQMNTLGGVLKQFESFKAATAEGIGNSINEPLKELLKTILDIARAAQEKFVNKFSDALKTIIHWIHQCVISFEIIKMKVSESGTSFMGLKNIANFVFTTINKVMEKLIPVITKIITSAIVLADTLSVFLSPAIIIIKGVVITLINVFSTVISYIDRFIPLIGALASGIGVLTLAIKAQQIATALSAASAIVAEKGFLKWLMSTKLMTVAQGALNAVMALNPIALIIAGVVALTALLILLYKKCEPFREFIDNLWSKIQEFFTNFITSAKTVINNITQFFTGLIDSIVNIFNTLKEFFGSFWGSLKEAPLAIVEFIVSIFTNMIDNIKNKLFGFIDDFKNGISKIKDFGGGLIGKAVNFISGGQDTPTSKAVDSAVGNVSTYYGNQSASNTINAPTTMNISVPSGTSSEQAKVISEQIQYAYNSQLAYAINSSRSNIPSPEKRRY